MKLALFFTRNVSMKTWLETGLLDREKLLYEKHLRSGALAKVYWLTYGVDDAELAEQLKSKADLTITSLSCLCLICSAACVGFIHFSCRWFTIVILVPPTY